MRGSTYRGPTRTSLSPEEEKLLQSLTEGPLACDEISRRVVLNPGRAASLLMRLELQKKVTKKRDGNFALLKA